jgi:hypothetical protein
MFSHLWETFWGKDAPECFVEHTIRIPNARTLEIPEDETTFTYLRLPDDSSFPCNSGRILITETYMSLYDKLCEEDTLWAREAPEHFAMSFSMSHSTVVTGQSGIGMSAATLTPLPLNVQDNL